MSEGQPSNLRLDGPQTAIRGSRVPLSGVIKTSGGVQVSNIELQVVPPPGTIRNFTLETKAPGDAILAIAGVRVNSQLPDHTEGPANFALLKAGLYETGKTKNLISNGDFDDDLRNWFVSGNASIRIVADGFGKSLAAQCSTNQSVSVTSLPATVIPGRSYTVSFDSRIFEEGRNSGYFFVAWLALNDEVRRDRFFMKFPDRQTIASTSSRSDGRFSFDWTPQETGAYSLFAFFQGTRSIQPSISRLNINVQ
jgi:hypothetical protein